MPLRTGRQLAVGGLRHRTGAHITNRRRRPVVTAIAGPLTGGSRADAAGLAERGAGQHNGKTYVIWDGQRSEIDLANKAVALALGVDSDAPPPVPMSTALFDAMPGNRSAELTR